MSNLNSEQKKAVTTTEGRVLILAGAGSGKTKVIVHRIAHLIQNKNIPAENILGLTFTNKAAEEMRERVAKLLTPQIAKKVVLSTFHSFCMRILRQDIHHLGYTKNFSLYEEREIKRLLKQIARESLSIDGQLPSIDPIAAKISQAKSRGIHPKDISKDDPDWQDTTTRVLYERLQVNMRAYNAVDFDSLLTLTVELFEQHSHILNRYQKQFLYIMIDEYQDTNPVQYKIVKLLSQKHNNLCVVGDDDQSIYGWRGAEIKNILTFESKHIIKLEQNYRSLPTILKAANTLIAHNHERHKKVLYSQDPETQPIILFHAPSEKEEAEAVIQRLLHLRNTRGFRLCDFAILYRSNILSRPFEIALMQAMWQKNGQWIRGIPYQIFGGTELYQRSEIKDLIAYLRFIANSKDEEALLRIINVPRRGISDQTLEILTKENRQKNIPLWDYMTSLSTHLEISKRGFTAIQNFIHLIETVQKDFYHSNSLKTTIQNFLEIIDYKRAIEEEVKSEQMRNFKWQNIQNYLSSFDTYEKESQAPSLEDFVTTTLLNQAQFIRKENNPEDRINLMTFHSAKGLEFESCFLVGLEDHLVPHEKSFQETGLEEERRLLYVAITRAKKFLTFSMAQTRQRFGKEEKSSPSRFLFEIPKELLRIVSWKNPF